MAIKAKSKKRLIILLVAMMVIVGAGIGVFAIRRNQLHRETMASLVAGRAAMAEENWFDAMHQLGRYSNKHPEDVDVLYEYSKARREVEAPRGQHLLQTVGVLRRVLDLNPDHDEARHDLMKLYVLLGYTTETLDTAEFLLKKDSENAEALRAKAVSLGRLRRFDEALPISMEFNQRKPLDLDGNILTLSLMRSLQKPSTDIQQRVEELHTQHLEDPRFELLMAIAYADNADNETAIEWCRAAAGRKPPDAEFVGRLVMMFDKFHLYDESTAILKTHASTMDNPYLFRALIRRLSDGQQFNELLDRLSDYPTDDTSDSEVLALKALTLFRLKRPDDARPIVNYLAGIEDDPTASAWALVFEKVIDTTNTDVKEMVDVCRKALRRSPNHPYFHHYLARAYHFSGEEDLALEQWAKAVRQAPTWQAPITQAAQALMATGRSKLAITFWDLLSRGKKNVNTVVTIAQIWFANLQTNDIAGAERLLRVVEVVQEQIPDEPRTLTINIALLARLGRTEEASEAIEKTLTNTEKQPSEVTLIKLAQTSRVHELGLEDDCLNRVQELYGMSVNLAYNGAVRLAKEGRVDEGLKWLEDAAAASQSQDDLPWQMARAQYLEAADDARATDAWISIADQMPDNRYVQQKAVQSPSVWRDREFVDRTIKRVRELYGDDSPTWRVARARWLLHRDSEKTTVSDAAKLLKDAVRIAPTMTAARTLLADVHRKQGNLLAAVSELAIAEQMSPHSLSIAVIRANLLKQQGDIEGAVTIIEDIVVRSDATTSVRHSAALLLSKSGRIDRAIEILEGLYEEELPANLLLARLYRKRRDYEKTEAVCRKLLEKPSGEIIQFAADFLAYRGRVKEAEQVLEGLRKLQLRDGSREMILAAFYGRHGELADAIDHSRAAIAADQSRSDTRLALISYLTAGDRMAEVVDEIQKSLTLFPEDDTFNFLNDHIELIRLAKTRIALRPLIASMIADKDYRTAAVEVLELLREEHRGRTDQTAFIIELRKLANRYPKFLPLQILIGRTYMAMKKTDAAISIAQRTMQAFPNRVEPIWLTTEALAGAGRREEALDMAWKWRTLAEERPMIADLVIGDLSVQLGQPGTALKQIEPYLKSATANPDTGRPVILLAARAMVADRRDNDAAKMIWPLTESSDFWRKEWMLLAIHTRSTEAVSIEWLEKIQSRIPDDATGDRVTLAQCWHTLGVRFRKMEHTNRGHKVLAEIANRSDAEVGAVLMLALMQDSLGQTEAAEQGYRRVLKMDPNQSIAQNNLSMIIATRPDELSEAVALALKAVYAKPNIAPFRDTLAQAQSKFGTLDQAIENLEHAILLEPRNVQWPANLATLYLDHERIEDAESMLIRIETGYQLNGGVPPDVRRQIQKLRDRLTNIQQARANTP